LLSENLVMAATTIMTPKAITLVNTTRKNISV